MNLYEDVAGEGALDMPDAAAVDAMSADEVAASFVLPWHKQGESPMIPRRELNGHADGGVSGANGVAHSNGNGHAHGDGYANGNGHAHGNGYANGNGHGFGHANGLSNGMPDGAFSLS